MPRTKNTRFDCCDTNPTSQKRRMWKSRYFYTKILYHLYNKKSGVFYFVQKFHEITIALSHSSEKIKPALSIKAGLYCFI